MRYVIHSAHGGFISKHWDKNSRDIPYTANPAGAMIFRSEGEARCVVYNLLKDEVLQIVDVLILLD